RPRSHARRATRRTTAPRNLRPAFSARRCRRTGHRADAGEWRESGDWRAGRRRLPRRPWRFSSACSTRTRKWRTGDRPASMLADDTARTVGDEGAEALDLRMCGGDFGNLLARLVELQPAAVQRPVSALDRHDALGGIAAALEPLAVDAVWLR